jgi:hypothetical protein
MSTKCNILISSILAFFVAGCTGNGMVQSHTVPTDTRTPLVVSPPQTARLPESIETIAATPPATILVPEQPTYTPTAWQATSTPGLASLPIRQPHEQCLEVESILPPGFLTEGVLLFGDFTERGGLGYLMTRTAQDEQLHFLPDLPRYNYGYVSQEGNWFAYHYITEELEDGYAIISAGGQLQSIFSNETLYGLQKWLDNERLISFTNEEHPSNIILNPFTGDRQTISTVLPDFWRPEEYDFYYGWWAMNYDPTLTRLAYTAGGEGYTHLGIVLWDLQSNRELWRLVKESTVRNFPQWSPDGAHLAVAATNDMEDNWDRFELYIVSRDGIAIQWVDMKGYYKNAKVGEMKWSPDGRYLALAPVPAGRFLLLDTATYQLLDYCISSDVSFGRVIWSPDSNQVVVPRWGGNGGREPAIIIDVRQKKAAYINQDYRIRPVGWLLQPP